MSEEAKQSQEGTIQFGYGLNPGPSVAIELFSELAAWRDVLFRLDLLGQHPDRYDGFAYGNISGKTADADEFVITASQTSGAPELTPENVVTITGANLQRFWVDAQGSEPPSSETLTHAMIYQADPRMRFVFHVHSPVMWRYREQLGLPQTAADVPYGTPAMTAAVDALLDNNQSRPLVFATAGHEDGIFALGHHERDCGGLLVSYLAKAQAIELASALNADAST